MQKKLLSFFLLFFLLTGKMFALTEVSEEHAYYQNLCTELKRQNYLYYVEGRPEMADAVYDQRMKELIEIENTHPDWITNDSPTQKIGEDLIDQKPITFHKMPMLSMNRTKDFEGLRDFDRKLVAQLGKKVSYFVEEKIDGVAISLQYEKGILKRAVTRGDGKKGNNVTHLVQSLPSLRQKISVTSDFLEIRGEIYISKRNFLEVNQQRMKSGKQLFANARNLTAGSLHLGKMAVDEKRNLQLVVYGMGDGWKSVASTQREVYEGLKKLGFQTPQCGIFCESMEEAIYLIQQWKNKKDLLPYEVDGMVIKVNGLAEQQQLGATSRVWRGVIAYKFSGIQAQTTLKKIQWQVGRTGRISPVLILEPVSLDGSQINRVAFHPSSEWESEGIYENDFVIIEKAGRTIPKVIGVTKNTAKPTSIKLFPTKECPDCKEPIFKSGKSKFVYECHNRFCSGRLKRAIEYFCGRGQMNISGVGPALAERFVNSGLVKEPMDLYSLDKEKLKQKIGMSENQAEKLLGLIEASKKNSFEKFLTALGIRYVGKAKAIILAKYFIDWETFQTATAKELENIPELGPTTTTSIMDYFHTKEKIPLPKIFE